MMRYCRAGKPQSLITYFIALTSQMICWAITRSIQTPQGIPFIHRLRSTRVTRRPSYTHTLTSGSQLPFPRYPSLNRSDAQHTRMNRAGRRKARKQYHLWVYHCLNTQRQASQVPSTPTLPNSILSYLPLTQVSAIDTQTHPPFCVILLSVLHHMCHTHPMATDTGERIPPTLTLDIYKLLCVTLVMILLSSPKHDISMLTSSIRMNFDVWHFFTQTKLLTVGVLFSVCEDAH